MFLIDGIVEGVRTAFEFVTGQGDDDAGSTEAVSPRGARTVATRYEGPVDPKETTPRDELSTTLRRRTGTSSPDSPSSPGTIPPHLRASRTPLPDSIGGARTSDVGAGGGGTSDLVRSVAESVRSAAREGSSSDVAAAATSAVVRVFDSQQPQADGTAGYLGDTNSLASSDGASSAHVAARHVQGGLDYFARTFGRDGIDGAGRGVDVVINDHSRDAESGALMFEGNGGFYSVPTRDGGSHSGIRFGPGSAYETARGALRQHEMLYADDLSVHELVHGIIHAETGQHGGDADEPSATNEAVADVLAASATRDWRIGEGMYADDSAYRLMRNIAQPDDPTAVHGLHTHVTQFRAAVQSGSAEEHYGSGVISTAAARIQQRLGGEAGWQAVERVFYDVVDNGRLGDMSFATVAAGLRAAAGSLYGPASAEARVVDEELRRAGL